MSFESWNFHLFTSAPKSYCLISIFALRESGLSSKKWWQMMDAETKTTIFLMRLCADVCEPGNSRIITQYWWTTENASKEYRCFHNFLKNIMNRAYGGKGECTNFDIFNANSVNNNWNNRKYWLFSEMTDGISNKYYVLSYCLRNGSKEASYDFWNMNMFAEPIGN